MAGTLTDLVLFPATTFVAAVVTGLVGFAFGLIAAAVWLHIFTPLQTATLIIALGLVVQGYSVWQLRKVLDWNRLWKFLIGLPVLLAGTWFALRLYGRLAEARFRKLILALLLMSGVTLIL
jgi:uncharacterized membrane protein YfcA